MPVDVTIYGFFAPILLLVLVASIVLFVVLDLVLARFRVYRFAWHPTLFRVAIFISLFCAISLLVQR
jgi:protein AaeX